MSDWDIFWSMGGYGTYVWSAYGITIAVLIVNAVAAIRRLRILRRKIREDAE